MGKQVNINEIYNEDCITGMKRIDDKSIDLILQDPPYNMTACDFEWDIMTKIDEFWAEWKRIIKDNGAIIMTASQPFTSKLVMSNLEMFKYEWIWDKKIPGNFMQVKYQPLKYHENICVFSKKTHNYYPQFRNKVSQPFGKISAERASQHINIADTKVRGIGYPKSILNYSRPNNLHNDGNLHPTQKPVALFEYLIRTYTNEDEVVFDGFLGSGTTAVACINTNRNYIGFELDKKYYDIAQQRIKEATAQLRLF